MAEPHPQTEPAPTSQRARQRAETHERIFQAAVAEFREVGYAEAQIPRIAEAAGVVRGTFYFHFPSKEHVLRELVDRVQGGLVASLDSDDVHDLPFHAWMDHLVEEIGRLDESLSEADLIRDVIALHIREDQREDEPNEPRPTALAMRAAVQGRLERARQDGEVRADLDPETTAGLILSSIFGVMAAPRDERAGRRPELAMLVDLLLRGTGPAPRS